MIQQEEPLPKSVLVDQEQASQGWEEIKARLTPEGAAIVAFEKGLANARQTYEMAVIEAWRKFQELGEEPDQWPPGYEGSRTRRKTVLKSWKRYEEELAQVLESLQKWFGDNNLCEYGDSLAAEERADLGGSVPTNLQDILDRVQEDITWVQDTLNWVQEVIDESQDEVSGPDGCQARDALDLSLESTKHALNCCEAASDAADTHQAIELVETAGNALEQALSFVDALESAAIGYPDPDITARIILHLGEVEQCLDQILYDLGGVEAGLEHIQIPERQNNWFSLNTY